MSFIHHNEAMERLFLIEERIMQGKNQVHTATNI